MPHRPRQVGRRASTGAVVVAAATLLSAGTQNPAPACVDPFAFLAPSITIGTDERREIDAGEPVVRILPGEGREIAVLAAVAVDFDGDRVVEWMRRIDLLKKSRHVPAVARFSDPPVLADLETHALTDQDLESLRECRVGRCDLKLSAAEIARMQQALAVAGDDWKAAGEQVFRRVALDRVIRYRESGLAGVGAWADGHTDAASVDRFRRLVDRSPYLVERTPALVTYLTGYPAETLPNAESFVYWSIDQFGGRPVTSATHVVMVRPEGSEVPDVLVAGKQIFATHYQDGALSLTMLFTGCPGPPHYLVYINRSQVDVIRGLMGWLARRIIQGRVEDDAATVLTGLRDRMAEPPPGIGGEG